MVNLLLALNIFRYEQTSADTIVNVIASLNALKEIRKKKHCHFIFHLDICFCLLHLFFFFIMFFNRSSFLHL